MIFTYFSETEKLHKVRKFKDFYIFFLCSNTAVSTYYDVDDISNYYEANYIYEGDITYSDTCTVFILVNTKPPFDILTLRLPSIGINSMHVVGLISTITYFYQSIAMKVIASENPLPLNDELKNALHISSDELKNIKRTNFFFAQ